MTKESDLISAEYKALMLKTHEVNPNWGNGGKRHYLPIVNLIQERGLKTALDYGCGMGLIGKELLAQRVLKPEQLQMYDPGMPGLDKLPVPADLLICTDVLEHIEPAKLDGLLTFLRFLAGKVAYLHIAISPAKKILPDGRNAHLIVQPASWWQEKLSAHWSKVTSTYGRDGFIHPTFVCE